MQKHVRSLSIFVSHILITSLAQAQVAPDAAISKAANLNIYALASIRADAQEQPITLAVDGNPSTYFSSPSSTSDSVGHSIEMWLSDNLVVSDVLMVPHLVSGKAVGFPAQYRISIWSETSSSWISTGVYTRQPGTISVFGYVVDQANPDNPTQQLYVHLRHIYRTRGIKIETVQLGKNSSGKYGLELAEIGLAYPKVSRALSFQSQITRLKPGQTSQIVPTNGSGPYKYRAPFQPGKVSGAGVFTAPSIEGTSVVSVEDSQGLMGYAVFVVSSKPEITVAPQITNATFFPRSLIADGYIFGCAKQLSITGGTGPFTYKTVQGPSGATAGGLFRCGFPDATEVVEVLDAKGKRTAAVINILADFGSDLSMVVKAKSNSVVTTELESGSQATFLISRGVAPYKFRLSCNGSSTCGSITANGVYTAPIVGNGRSVAAVISVTDARGMMSDAYLTTLGPDLYAQSPHPH